MGRNREFFSNLKSINLCSNLTSNNIKKPEMMQSHIALGICLSNVIKYEFVGPI